jgi:antitoxin VapB
VSLNIKNPETHRLARELSDLTGESLTEAVTLALRERLARMRSTEDQVKARKEALMAIGRDIASRLSPEVRAIDHGDLLYDERGLPR